MITKQRGGFMKKTYEKPDVEMLQFEICESITEDVGGEFDDSWGYEEW